MDEKESLTQRVEKAIQLVRPALQSDGGDVELVEVKDKVARVKLVGACAGCPMSQFTLSMQIERIIKESVPEIERVVPA